LVFIYTEWAFGNLVEIWYIIHRFGILCPEKTGNPANRDAEVNLCGAKLASVVVVGKCGGRRIGPRHHFPPSPVQGDRFGPIFAHIGRLFSLGSF
jgi:hypothetical protein